MKLLKDTLQNHVTKLVFARRRMEYFKIAAVERQKMYRGEVFDVQLLAVLDDYLDTLAKPVFQISAQSRKIVAVQEDHNAQDKFNFSAKLATN